MGQHGVVIVIANLANISKTMFTDYTGQHNIAMVTEANISLPMLTDYMRQQSIAMITIAQTNIKGNI